MIQKRLVKCMQQGARQKELQLKVYARCNFAHNCCFHTQRVTLFQRRPLKYMPQKVRVATKGMCVFYDFTHTLSFLDSEIEPSSSVPEKARVRATRSMTNRIATKAICVFLNFTQ